MALAVGVWKLHEYEVLKNNWRSSQVLSYGRLAACYGMRKDQLQEVSVVGKLWQRPKKRKAEQDKRVVVFKQRQSQKAFPPPPNGMPHRCADIAQNSQSFSGPQLCSQSEISFEKTLL